MRPSLKTGSLICLLACLVIACTKEKAAPIIVDKGDCYDIKLPESNFGWWPSKQHRFVYYGPSFNPENSDEFVYLRADTSTEQHQLWKYQLETGKATFIADDITGDPDWGVNDWIVYERDNGSIWKIKSNGDSVTQLTNGYLGFYPFWSFDGNYIIYYRLTEIVSIAIIDKEGNMVRERDSTIYFGRGDWREDNQIAIGNGGSLYLYDLEKDSIVHLYTWGRNYHGACFLPGTPFIIWCTSEGILQTNIDSRETVLIKANCDSKTYSDPSVSREGDKLIVRRLNQDYFDGYQYFESAFYIMNMDGTNEQKIEVE